MTRDRKRLLAEAAGIAAIGVAGIIPAATPAQAEPDIDDVRKKVDKLYTQAEAANEDYTLSPHGAPPVSKLWMLCGAW